MSKVRSISPNSRVFYVYVLCDTRTEGPFKYGKFEFKHEPFYVGKGHGDRIISTCTYDKEIKKESSFKAKKINRILKDGYQVHSEIVFERLTEAKAFELESRLIKHLGRRNLGEGPLTNLTDGGEGNVGLVVSAKTRALLSSISKEQNANMTKAERKAKSRKLSEAHYNRTDEEEAERIAKMVTTMASKSEKELRKINKQRSKTVRATYAENGSEIMAGIHATKIERYGKQVSNWHFMSEEDKIECRRKISRALRDNPESEEHKLSRVAKMLKTWENMDDAKKKEILAKRNAASSAAWHNQTEEQKETKANKISKGHGKRTAEQKAETSRKLSEARKRYFQRMTSEEKDEWRKKISYTKTKR